MPRAPIICASVCPLFYILGAFQICNTRELRALPGLSRRLSSGVSLSFRRSEDCTITRRLSEQRSALSSWIDISQERDRQCQRIAHTETEPLRNIAVSPVQVVHSIGVIDYRSNPRAYSRMSLPDGAD